MSENIEKKLRINFGRLSEARKAKERKKVRESSVGALKCYKKWVTHDHESVNHPWSLAEESETIFGFLSPNYTGKCT